MSDRLMKIQERSRNGIKFYSIMSRSEYCRQLRKVKRKRDLALIDSDPVIQAVIRYAAVFVLRGGYDVLTVPPASSEGICWAGEVAERISVKTGVPFRQFFGPHNLGKRFYLGAKFRPIGFGWVTDCRGWKRVLVFDDFSMTNITITSTIREIRNQVECDGLVMCV